MSIDTIIYDYIHFLQQLIENVRLIMTKCTPSRGIPLGHTNKLPGAEMC